MTVNDHTSEFGTAFDRSESADSYHLFLSVTAGTLKVLD
jgi:hypothetical protein